MVFIHFKHYWSLVRLLIYIEQQYFWPNKHCYQFHQFLNCLTKSFKYKYILIEPSKPKTVDFLCGTLIIKSDIGWCHSNVHIEAWRHAELRWRFPILPYFLVHGLLDVTSTSQQCWKPLCRSFVSFCGGGTVWLMFYVTVQRFQRRPNCTTLAFSELLQP